MTTEPIRYLIVDDKELDHLAVAAMVEYYPNLNITEGFEKINLMPNLVFKPFVSKTQMKHFKTVMQCVTVDKVEGESLQLLQLPIEAKKIQ